ncbi:M20 metallopeptidase family protein [Planococcus lenghuensis]|uniref:Peptidase M20 n=1 Tax=Planococcus lenghuensis TaxID=2213202 RepID=A0A1Q2KW08_9BACL|nr:amidohydrolase [Planococcus lenghuensis]AQQ52405.1 peptidase M20 [Planococcus lenghuensis]
MPVNASFADAAENLRDSLIAWRRKLHRHPELSFQEVETARFITEELKKINGMHVQQGIGTATSVIGTLSAGEGPVIALRADIDALPIMETSEVEYRSMKEGVMHACGHDAHTAILLGAAVMLAEEFRHGMIAGTVKFVFQPAEEWADAEGLSGAPYLIQAGAYEKVEAAIALHMCPWQPVGAVQMNDGYSMASVDVFEAKLYGSGGHGAYPELGTDPVWMLGPVLQAVHGIVARRISAMEPAVISIGQIHAGTASNIIPAEVSIEGTIRCYSADTRTLIASELKKAFSIVETLGGTYSLVIHNGEPALNNDPFVNRLISAAIHEQYPAFTIVESPFGMGGEDFGYVTEQLPGAMFFLGCAPAEGNRRNLHTSAFDIDEACLPAGAAILAKAAVKFLTGADVSGRGDEDDA